MDNCSNNNSLNRLLIFGFGLELMKVLAYLFFAYFLIAVIKKWMQFNWKITTAVIIAIAVIAVCRHIVFGKGLDILIWFICLIAIYEVLSSISSLVKKKMIS